MGVCETSIFNWKSNKGTPEIRFMPAIIRFLGYNPLPEAATLAEQLVRRRTALGKSQKESALKLGVDAGTLATWERGEREPNSPRQISKTAENWRISKKVPFKFNGLQGRSAEPWRIGDFCHRQLTGPKRRLQADIPPLPHAAEVAAFPVDAATIGAAQELIVQLGWATWAGS
jgi:transcriptional regulator with XRE-family HTH domain